MSHDHIFSLDLVLEWNNLKTFVLRIAGLIV